MSAHQVQLHSSQQSRPWSARCHWQCISVGCTVPASAPLLSITVLKDAYSNLIKGRFPRVLRLLGLGTCLMLYTSSCSKLLCYNIRPWPSSQAGGKYRAFVRMKCWGKGRGHKVQGCRMDKFPSAANKHMLKHLPQQAPFASEWPHLCSIPPLALTALLPYNASALNCTAAKRKHA